jgi:hypothetical protein
VTFSPPRAADSSGVPELDALGEAPTTSVAAARMATLATKCLEEVAAVAAGASCETVHIEHSAIPVLVDR